VFRVGVVGHRPNRLTAANLTMLSAQVGEVLALIRREVEAFAARHASLFSSDPPALRAVSPLAEGTDRLFAEQALVRGYELCCPMPFPQEEFERDFTPPHALEPDSLNRFRALLERGRTSAGFTKCEMDGDRALPDQAYGACGHVVLNQSDLLVVVWDGVRTGKRGGTEETLDEAGRKGVPIILIDARAPHGWQVLTSSAPAVRPAPGAAASTVVSALEEVVREALEVPDAKSNHSGRHASGEGTTIGDFLDESQMRINTAPWWTLFRDVVGNGMLRLPVLRVTEYEQAALKEWPRNQTAPHARIIDRLRPFYAWPDALAIRYSDIYRSAFVVAYLFAGLAVGMALLPLAMGWDVFEPHLAEAVFVFGELALIVCIVLMVWRGRRRRWHQRWMDYRLVAELVRHLRLTAPYGSVRPYPQVPAQWASYGDPASTWMAWYVRAVERDLGIPSVRLDAAHLTACARDLIGTIRGQIVFHAINEHRSHVIERRLHVSGLALLGVTVVACTTHLVLGAGTMPASPQVLGTLVFLAGFLPAMGAAVAGINNQGEFRRLAMRSEAMLRRLEELEARARALAKRIESTAVSGWCPGASGEASDLAAQAAQLMLNEVLDWRVVFLDRPLREP
jgi:hypothetical protein